MSCTARIRPLPNHVEIFCDRGGDDHDLHAGTLRDYAYPGSETKITWAEEDRRTFHGDWPGPCPSRCSLPAGHHGRHA